MPVWIHTTLPWYKQWAKATKLEETMLLAPKFLKILERQYVVIPNNFKDVTSI
jgi:hypothetical protein